MVVKSWGRGRLEEGCLLLEGEFFIFFIRMTIANVYWGPVSRSLVG